MSAQCKSRENPFINVGFNIVLPAIIMSKADDWFGVEPATALIVALIFPISHGCWDFFKEKRCNVFSIVGFFSVLLTGIIGLLQLPKEYVAIKEAAVPLILGLFVIISAYTKCPIIKTLIFNDSFINMELLESKLKEKESTDVFRRLLSKGTIQFSWSFFLSAVLNYILARYFIHSETGTSEFNKELGRMTFWSYPVIVLPCTIILMWVLLNLMKKVEKITGLSLESIFLPSSKTENKPLD